MLFIIFCLLDFIQSIVFAGDGLRPPVCFLKNLLRKDKLIMNFVLTSEHKQTFNVEIKEITSNETIYFHGYIEQGSYKSKEPLEEGTYRLCFYPADKGRAEISLNYYTLNEENDNLIDLASDTELKGVGKEIEEIKGLIEEIVNNARFLIDRRLTHLKILKEIIKSLKFYTVLKFITVTILSTFQIYIIRKFFGNEKRVSNIKASFSGKNDFL